MDTWHCWLSLIISHSIDFIGPNSHNYPLQNTQAITEQEENLEPFVILISPFHLPPPHPLSPPLSPSSSSFSSSQY